MSGQPYRYASDPERFRAEFMKTLALQADINSLNLDANKTYISTGSLPAISQLPDTRTTSEILADVEKLKVSLMEDLKPLGNANFTSAIIQAIQSSPLNVDGSLFTFFAQRAPEIVSNVSKQYKFGIKGDKNDVERFVKFVEDMYNKSKSLTSSVKGYFLRPSESASIGVINFGELEKIVELYNEVARKLMLKFNYAKTPKKEGYRGPSGSASLPSEELESQIYFIALELKSMGDFLNQEEYIKNTETFLDSQIFWMGNPETTDIVDNFFDLYKRYNEILEEFPKSETIFSLIRQLDNSVANSTTALSLRILKELQGQLTKSSELDELTRELKKSREEFEKAINTDSRFPGAGERLGGPKMTQEELDALDRRIDFNTNKLGFLESREADQERQEQRKADKELETEIKTERTTEDMDKLGNEIETRKKQISKLEAEYRNVELHLRDLRSQIKENEARERTRNREYELQKLKSTEITEERHLEELSNDYDTLKGDLDALEAEMLEARKRYRKASGHGIKRRGRPKGSGIATPKTYKDSVKAHSVLEKGIMESPRFIKFGKYLINSHKLNNEDIFALKRPSGGNIVEIPSVRISKNLSSVIKKMVGGSIPTFSELSKLSEPERAYLHKVSSKANILDKFSIPTPSKDQTEKDIHDFEVMKGEILAGNDSKDLIKKFKLHLMKLSKNGSLPKKEVQEIMEELIEMGF